MAGPVLVLGGQGFLGSRICEALRESGEEVFAAGRSAELRADLLNPSSLDSALDETEPEAVVCAAGVSSTGGAIADPAACLKANVTGFSNLVAAIGRCRPGCHLTLLSSAAVYSPSTEPLTENSETRPGSIYVASKLAAEKICDWQLAEGRPVAVVRVFNLIGPGQGADQVPGEFARAAVARETVRVRNPLINRDFTDVRDAGRAIAGIASERIKGTFNLCSGKTLSLQELAGLFGDLNLDASLEPRAQDPNSILGDPARLQRTTGWTASILPEQSARDLLSGLRKG